LYRFKCYLYYSGRQSNYTWSLPGLVGTDYNIISGGTGTSNNSVTVAWLIPGSKTVTVNYKNAAGCPGNTAATSTITVNQTQAPSVSISSPTTSVCSSTNVTFTAAPVNGGTTPTYQWRLNGAIISGATGATYSRNSWVSGNSITVTMTSNYACASPTAATSNSIAMVVSTQAPASIASNSITGPTSICPPVSDIVYTVTPVLRAETYNWTLPAGFTITSGAGTNTITVSVSNAAIIANNQDIKVYASNACGNGSDNRLRVNVNNFAGIDAGPDRIVCAGNTITLAGVWSGNTSASTWTASSGNFSYDSLPTSTYTPSITSGTVTLTLTTSDPAGSCPAVTDEMVVTVNQPAAITTQPVSQTTCSGSTVTLSVAATGTGLTYQWKKASTLLVDGVNISGANTPTLTLSNVTSANTGTYSVIVNGAPPCGTIISSVVTLTVNNAVSISTQPAVSKNTCAGDSVSLTVTSSGTGTKLPMEKRYHPPCGWW
jgi:hypothetical protein